jgi:hypothetical protein
LHIYSALNRDAVRAFRRRDIKLAVLLGKAAGRLEHAPEMRKLVVALAPLGPFDTTAALARALSAPAVAQDLAALERYYIETRSQLAKTVVPTVLAGRVAGLDDATAFLRFPHHGSTLPMPRRVVYEAGVAQLGAAVSAFWEVLPGGRTLITIEAAVDNPELTAENEPLTDIYGSPWGRILSEADSDALAVVGNPTVVIPDGIPDVP